MMKNEYYSFYLIWFSNDRLKFGITRNPKQRFNSYLCECRRNDIEAISSIFSSPVFSKETGLHMERTFRKLFKDDLINGQRESISLKGNEGLFSALIPQMKSFYKLFIDEYSSENEECFYRMGTA